MKTRNWMRLIMISSLLWLHDFFKYLTITFEVEMALTVLSLQVWVLFRLKLPFSLQARSLYPHQWLYMSFLRLCPHKESLLQCNYPLWRCPSIFYMCSCLVTVLTIHTGHFPVHAPWFIIMLCMPKRERMVFWCAVKHSCFLSGLFPW